MKEHKSDHAVDEYLGKISVFLFQGIASVYTKQFKKPSLLTELFKSQKTYFCLQGVRLIIYFGLRHVLRPGPKTGRSPNPKTETETDTENRSNISVWSRSQNKTEKKYRFSIETDIFFGSNV